MQPNCDDFCLVWTIHKNKGRAHFIFLLHEIRRRQIKAHREERESN
jgi:hypothetical protein